MLGDYEYLINEIKKLTDIDLSQYKEKQMHRRIDNLIARSGYNSYEDYVKKAKVDPETLHAFLNHMTINVSEFYRNPEQWKIFDEEILPSILTRTKTPNIWSAACSTGDEPYTLAMILLKHLPSGGFKITATDIDELILARAAKGEYSQKSVVSLPKEYLQKHFVQGEPKFEEPTFIINDNLKKYITFKRHNLLKDAYLNNVDLIVCRNVLIYFTEEAKSDIYHKFSKSLNTSGILFIGSTEQIIYSKTYQLNALKNFFYQKEQPELALK